MKEFSSHLHYFESGTKLFLQGKFQEAKSNLLTHLRHNSGHAETCHLLGLIAQGERDFPKAIEWMEKAIKLSPQTGEYYGNLGNALEAVGEKDRALECYVQAVRLCPKSPDLLANYSTMLWHRQDLDGALECARRALALNPNLPAALYAMGNACKDLGLIDDSLRSYQRAKAAGPGIVPLESGYLYALNYHPYLSASDIAIEHKNWAIQFAEPLTRSAPPFENDLTIGRKLRVGYVSTSFRDHAINFFVEPLLRNHDKDMFEVYCYSDVMCPDHVTERLKASVDVWRSLVGLDDQSVWSMIRNDRIDILVDLHGHMGGVRILVFARRAAPIQVTYIGYQATTGMSAMDYRLSDEYADPTGMTEQLHSEKLFRLSPYFFCFQPPEEAPEISPSPFLKNGYITFGSFNAVNKISEPVLAAWANILRKLPSAKLRILAPDASSLHQRLGMSLLRLGVKQHQIEFVIRSNRRRYLERIAEADIALDPFPFNGHTTSCDALWMGLPVVMRRGESYVKRYGSSALLSLGLNDLIADSDERYVATAIQLAGDLDRLKKLRSSLRPIFQSSPLMDFEAFSKNLSAAYQKMWADHVWGTSRH